MNKTTYLVTLLQAFEQLKCDIETLIGHHLNATEEQHILNAFQYVIIDFLHCKGSYKALIQMFYNYMSYFNMSISSSIDLFNVLITNASNILHSEIIDIDFNKTMFDEIKFINKYDISITHWW
jgi:hypothetical protein